MFRRALDWRILAMGRSVLARSSLFTAYPSSSTLMDIASVFDGDITQDEFERWLSQFTEADQPLAIDLTLHFRYYSLRRMNEALRRLYQQVLASAGVPADRLRFIPVGYVAKSGSVIAYYFRKQNQLKEDRFLSSQHVAAFEGDSSLVPVLIDDFIGSGHQSLQVVNEFRAAAPRFGGTVMFAALVGLSSGLDLLRAEDGVLPIAADVVPTADLPFGESSTVFPDAGRRQAALEMVTRYGHRLYPQHPLGYAESQGLIGFFYSTPNNTLPIFWSTEEGWAPLLPHGESFRDPSYLFGPPAGLTAKLVDRGPTRLFEEGLELDKYDIPEEMAVRIFGEFHKVPIFLVLAPIVRDLGMSSTGFTALLSAVSHLRNLEHEQHAVRSAVLIAKTGNELNKHGAPLVKVSGGLTLAESAELGSAAQLVDGLAGAVVATPDGRVSGAVVYPKRKGTIDPLLPRRYRSAALATESSYTLCFVFLGAGRIQVFHGGKRLLSYRHAAWHLQLQNFSRGLVALAKQHGIESSILTAVVRLALLLADEAKGALLTVGDHEGVLALSDPPKTGHLEFVPLHMGTAPDEMLTGLMTQDGATIVAANGTVMQTMTFLRPPVGTEADEEVGRGSKHSTAAKISKATGCVAVAISVDGRVTLYGKGVVRLKIMG